MRRGGRAMWMGPGGAALLAPAVMAAAVLVAGCGQVPSGRHPPRGRPAVAQDWEPTGGPPAGSRSQARAFAQELLSRLVLPPGARGVRPRALPPQALPQPDVPSGGTHRAEVHQLYLLSQPMPAVQSFLEAHVPAGMRLFSYSLSAGADPGAPTPGGRTADPGSVTTESVSFQPRAVPAGIYLAELATADVTGANGGSILRAEAAVIWYPHRSAAEYVDPRRVQAVRISALLLNPRSHTVMRTFTSGGVIDQLARRLDGLPAAPFVPPSCLMTYADYRLTFIPAAPARTRVVVMASGCIPAWITVGGVAQRQLWGGGVLARAAMRLLHMKPSQR